MEIQTAMLNQFGFIALGFTILAYVPYWYAIIRDGQRPEKATWLVWISVDAVIAGAMFVQGAIAYLLIAYLLGSGSICMYALIWGESGWTREDKIVLAGAGLALILWLTASANAAIVLSLIAIEVGTIPTIHRLWLNPDAEPRVSWWMFLVGGAGAGALQPL